MADRLWFGTERPFTAARQACAQLDDELKRWGAEIQHESAAICRDVLGVRRGDTVVASVGGKMVRLQVEQMGVIDAEKEVLFHAGGTRFRKDGTLGKREESVYQLRALVQ